MLRIVLIRCHTRISGPDYVHLLPMFSPAACSPCATFRSSRSENCPIFKIKRTLRGLDRQGMIKARLKGS
jgi:hypothetical protein